MSSQGARVESLQDRESNAHAVTNLSFSYSLSASSRYGCTMLSATTARLIPHELALSSKDCCSLCGDRGLHVPDVCFTVTPRGDG